MRRGANAYDMVCVVADRLTKSINLIPIQQSFRAERLGKIYVWEIVRYHGVLHTILSDRDVRFLVIF